MAEDENLSEDWQEAELPLPGGQCYLFRRPHRVLIDFQVGEDTVASSFVAACIELAWAFNASDEMTVHAASGIQYPNFASELLVEYSRNDCVQFMSFPDGQSRSGAKNLSPDITTRTLVMRPTEFGIGWMSISRSGFKNGRNVCLEFPTWLRFATTEFEEIGAKLFGRSLSIDEAKFLAIALLCDRDDIEYFDAVEKLKSILNVSRLDIPHTQYSNENWLWRSIFPKLNELMRRHQEEFRLPNNNTDPNMIRGDRRVHHSNF